MFHVIEPARSKPCRELGGIETARSQLSRVDYRIRLLVLQAMGGHLARMIVARSAHGAEEPLRFIVVDDMGDRVCRDEQIGGPGR